MSVLGSSERRRILSLVPAASLPVAAKRPLVTPPPNVKSKNVAFGLNFLLPGAGFAYLGRWKLAAINLGVALGIGLVLAFVLPESFLDSVGRYLGLGFGGGSGVWAMQVAEQMNEAAEVEAKREPTLEEVSERARFS